jgi:hypothetical protein
MRAIAAEGRSGATGRPRPYQWSLAKSNLDRAAHSADILRGLLFSAAAAGIGFVVYGRQGIDLRIHVIPLVLLGLGAALVYVSWDIQKGKSIGRFEALRDGRYDYDRLSVPRNYVLDRIAATAIASGAMIEIAVRMYQPAEPLFFH